MGGRNVSLWAMEALLRLISRCSFGPEGVGLRKAIEDDAGVHRMYCVLPSMSFGALASKWRACIVVFAVWPQACLSLEYATLCSTTSTVS